MPIVISRETGKIISQPTYTQEQIDQLAEKILRNWIRDNPEKLRDLK